MGGGRGVNGKCFFFIYVMQYYLFISDNKGGRIEK